MLQKSVFGVEVYLTEADYRFGRR